MFNQPASKLDPKKRYLQIAVNGDMSMARRLITALPLSDRILIEAGTSFVKRYGVQGIAALRSWWNAKMAMEIGQSFLKVADLSYIKSWRSKIVAPAYIVADLKCMDRGSREVEAAAGAGASAATCLGLAPIETINEFIKSCRESRIDSMVDMMNVPFPFEILQKLKKLPTIVVLHRGVDENEQNREKMIPHHQIQRIKGTYQIMISVAGGENQKEVMRTYFNDAEIAVVWRAFYENPGQAAELAKDFLKNIK